MGSESVEGKGRSERGGTTRRGEGEGRGNEKGLASGIFAKKGLCGEYKREKAPENDGQNIPVAPGTSLAGCA